MNGQKEQLPAVVGVSPTNSRNPFNPDSNKTLSVKRLKKPKFRQKPTKTDKC